MFRRRKYRPPPPPPPGFMTAAEIVRESGERWDDIDRAMKKSPPEFPHPYRRWYGQSLWLRASVEQFLFLRRMARSFQPGEPPAQQ